MKRTSVSVTLITCLLLFVQCNLRTKSFNTWFWTSNKEESCHLFVDEEDMGPLPQLDSAPSCENADMKKQALFLHLPSGNYDLEVKDAKGDVRYAEQLQLKRTSGSLTIGSSTHWNEGGSRGTNMNDCVIREIWY